MRSFPKESFVAMGIGREDGFGANRAPQLSTTSCSGLNDYSRSMEVAARGCCLMICGGIGGWRWVSGLFAMFLWSLGIGVWPLILGAAPCRCREMMEMMKMIKPHGLKDLGPGPSFDRPVMIEPAIAHTRL
jgi:hypothetical protein